MILIFLLTLKPKTEAGIVIDKVIIKIHGIKNNATGSTEDHDSP
jgi:hypothetical protein